MVSLGGVRPRCLVFQDTVMASAIASRRQDLWGRINGEDGATSGERG
jgi:hypothetical protein